MDRELAELTRRAFSCATSVVSNDLPPHLQVKVLDAIELTKNNDRLILNVAFNYGGRDEIVNAIQNIIKDGIPPEDVTEVLVSRYLYTAGRTRSGPDRPSHPGSCA